MNAIHQQELEMVAQRNSPGNQSGAIKRAQMCHFLELVLAHPGEDGHEYFRKESTEAAFIQVYCGLLQGDSALCTKGEAAAREFFSALRRMSYEDIESAHIGLFTNNYPHLPCPPYGSLFTAADSEKRLEEMLSIKAFYQRHDIDIAETFDDLPDHLCVELEFLQVLCFRESEAAAAGDREVLAGVRATQAEFLDRYLLPFVGRLAEIGVQSVPENPFSHLLEVTRCFLVQHRQTLGETAVAPSPDREI